MPRILAVPLPEDAFLARYRDSHDYTDSFRLIVPGHIKLGDYINAFYTTPLFRLERLVLAVLLGKRSSDTQVASLAAGTTTRFAAWTVEARGDDQILLCDFLGYSRSWLMCLPSPDGAATCLHFGSAIVPRRVSATGKASFDPGFHLLKGFHLVYSRGLLASAAASLRKRRMR